MSKNEFSKRHIGPNKATSQHILEALGCSTTNQLVEHIIPSQLRNTSEFNLPAGLKETEFLEKAKTIASKNKVAKCFIGMGYYGTKTPTVIQRNILENPAWYTAYTPYQAEISQGRMEALLNFQTLVTELTGMDMANASLLDEGTAIAEATSMFLAKKRCKEGAKVFSSSDLFPQSTEVLKTRLSAAGFIHDTNTLDHFLKDPSQYEVLVLQYPNVFGEAIDFSDVIKKAKDNNVNIVVAADLLSLCLLKPPGEWGADAVVGTTQRFGVPMGFGGPHAAFFATKTEYSRLIPGRIIGVSKDVHGRPAMRLALQTREQHIRRERATSNICTAQVLLAVIASMYAVYHGEEGLKTIASDIHKKTLMLSHSLNKAGFKTNTSFFDTLSIDTDSPQKILKAAEIKNIQFGFHSNKILISLNETTTEKELLEILEIFKISALEEAKSSIPQTLLRSSSYLKQDVFNKFHSETELLRYIRHLEEKDLSLVHSMIPLGSCTMKLNATTEMIPISWPEFNSIHPFAPKETWNGYTEMINELDKKLSEITGFDKISFQPNAGSQGEYAGLLVIKKYFESLGQDRNICLIPSSAHGTNPASAVMAGLKVVVVKCLDNGDIDISDLQQKAEEHKENLAALMVTYPSTHGVFEEKIKEIIDIIHNNGGQVYMDGANLNALVGLARPGDWGADVAHLNLHKTFCIPHGGGGPGVGPIGVRKHLTPFLPNHSIVDCALEGGIGAISSAPWGNASVLPITWGYIEMMGREGLQNATEMALANANYISKKLEGHYQTLYTNEKGWVAHECILDTREFKKTAGITVDDIAKRLMDYGFHAPTMSWPVVGTLMIEPTESESKEELDKFIEAMVCIRNEIKKIENGEWPQDNNPLKNAPHTALSLTTDWDKPYTREQAVFPTTATKNRKFWPSVGRVDNAYGDRNLVCSCPDISEYA